MGTVNHARRVAVDFSGKSGASAVIVMSETSDSGALWRLNTPEFNDVASQGNQFTLTAPNGATMVCTVIEPAQPKFSTGRCERGGGAGHAGYGYRGKKYINNKWIEFACAKNVLVAITLQIKGQAAPKVTGTGTAIESSMTVGPVAVKVAADGPVIQSSP